VNVNVEVSLIETTNDILGGTFADESINDLPLNGRDFQNLVVLRPGVQRSPGGGFLSISSNGNRPEDNNFIVEGTDDNDPYYATTIINQEGVQGTPGSILPIDAIQEFNCRRKSSGRIRLEAWRRRRSRHQVRHQRRPWGTAYGFERNSFFDARNYFDPKPDPQRALRQHQFGGSLGASITRIRRSSLGPTKAFAR
jgi:hypothetical protein